MKVLCCGSRTWTNWAPIWRELRALGAGTVIVEGEAPGADKMCGYVGKQLGYEVLKHPADWEQFGKSAGVIRNGEMLQAHPDIGLVLAFTTDIENSRGTHDMKTRAEAAGIDVKVIGA